MKKTSLLAFIIVWTCLFPGGLLALDGAELYDHGDPTGGEQWMLEMINRARFDPAAEGQRFLETTDTDVVGAINYFSSPEIGMDIEAVAAEFATYAPRPPMAFNSALMDVANQHSLYMISIDQQTHNRVDSSTNANAFRDSFTNAGYNLQSWIGENVFARSVSEWYGHAALNIDWGAGGNAVNGIQTPPGHRRTIMGLLRYPGDPYTYPDYREVGIAVIPENDNGTSVGPLVISQDFGRVSGETFLTGVVYNDSDADGFYTPGEGIGGVTVMPASGDYYAVTSASGGYAIPFFGHSGTVDLSISGGGVPARDVTIMMEGENVKVDVIDGEVVNDSHWRETVPMADYIKNSNVGLIRDITWPWVFHYGKGSWLHFRYAKRIDTALEGQLIVIEGNPTHWGWARDDMGPWYYDFNDAAWKRLAP